MKAKIFAVFLLCMVAIVAQAAIYRILSTDLYVNGMPPNLTTAQKAKWLDQVNISETNAAIDAGKYNPITTTNASKKVKELDKPVVVVPTCIAPQVLNVATNQCENPPPPVCIAPQVLNPTTNKCETPIVSTGPKLIETSRLPSGANFCGWGNTCTIPAGVTARVYYGVGQYQVYKDNVTGTIACSQSAIGNLGLTGSFVPTCNWVDNKNLLDVLDPKGQNLMPYVNAALTPKGAAGFSVPMVKADPIPRLQTFPYAGAFRISCNYSHGNFDDPIVWPGLVGASHHHTYFGNTSINAYSTSAGILKEGNSTCSGGILNRSGYWMPSLINTATGAPQKPSVVIVYYKAADDKNGAYIKAPPAGLRMIAGNARPRAIGEAEGAYECHDSTQAMNPANWGILWKDKTLKACGGGVQYLRMIISFPQCWDGKNLDSPDHKSHMAYACGNNCKDATGKIAPSANSCPASHPVAIPSIAINADFYGLDPNAKYRLASDNYSTTYPGGYSLHADWMNGWDEGTINRVVKNCLNNPRDCGGASNLGDGQKLYGVNSD